MKKTASSKARQKKNIFVCALRGVLTAALIALFLAAAAAFIGISMEDPERYTKIFAFASLLPAAFAGGFACARAKGHATLLCGALTGLFLLALIALAALCLSQGMSPVRFGVTAPCVLALCVLGAGAGVGTGG